MIYCTLPDLASEALQMVKQKKWGVLGWCHPGYIMTVAWMWVRASVAQHLRHSETAYWLHGAALHNGGWFLMGCNLPA